jgi:hypothetical protein
MLQRIGMFQLIRRKVAQYYPINMKLWRELKAQSANGDAASSNVASGGGKAWELPPRQYDLDYPDRVIFEIAESGYTGIKTLWDEVCVARYWMWAQ